MHSINQKKRRKKRHTLPTPTTRAVGHALPVCTSSVCLGIIMLAPTFHQMQNPQISSPPLAMLLYAKAMTGK